MCFLSLLVILCAVSGTLGSIENYGHEGLRTGDTYLFQDDYTIVIPDKDQVFSDSRDSLLLKFHYLMEFWQSDNKFKLLALEHNAQYDEYRIMESTAWIYPDWPTASDGAERTDMEWKIVDLDPFLNVPAGNVLGIYIRYDTIVGRDFYTIHNAYYSDSEQCEESQYETYYPVGDENFAVGDAFYHQRNENICRRYNYYAEYLVDGDCEEVDISYLTISSSYEEAVDNNYTAVMGKTLEPGQSYCWDVTVDDDGDTGAVVGVEIRNGPANGSTTYMAEQPLVRMCGDGDPYMDIIDVESDLSMYRICADYFDGDGAFYSKGNTLRIKANATHSQDYFEILVYKQKADDVVAGYYDAWAGEWVDESGTPWWVILLIVIGVIIVVLLIAAIVALVAKTLTASKKNQTGSQRVHAETGGSEYGGMPDVSGGDRVGASNRYAVTRQSMAGVHQAPDYTEPAPAYTPADPPPPYSADKGGELPPLVLHPRRSSVLFVTEAGAGAGAGADQLPVTTAAKEATVRFQDAGKKKATKKLVNAIPEAATYNDESTI